jgi:pyruvate dehydrogenase E2 component (dihydrolipoamide acetyltransferase)
MEFGVLLEWLVHPGDTVHKGDIVAVVDTSKAAVEIECFTDGVMGSLLVEPGTRVPVGDVLALIEGAEIPSAEPGEAVPTSPAAGPTAGGPAMRGAPAATPPVRQLAKQLNVDISAVTGTGAGGRITDCLLRSDGRGRTSAGVAAGPAPGQ